MQEIFSLSTSWQCLYILKAP